MGIGSVRRVGFVAVAVVAIVAACGGSDDDAGSTSVPSGSDAVSDVSAPVVTEPPIVTSPDTEPAATAATTPEPVESDPPTTDADVVPAELDQWAAVDPGEDCMCMDGSPFELWDRPADPTKVVLYFEGGGACFSAETCNFADSTATVNLALGTPPAGRGGLFDQSNPENPLADYSVVYVPYCSGDVHTGNKTTQYSPELTVVHNGYVNATAGLDYMLEAYPDIEDLVVMGASAGAVPTPTFAALAADELPEANVTTFGDSAGAYPDVPSVNASIGAGMWGTDTVGPDWPEYEGLTPEQRSIPGIYVLAMQHNPDITYARFDYAYDDVQAFFGGIAGFAADELVTLIDETAAQAETSGVPLASYVAPGTAHTIVAGDEFYDMEVEGVRLVDWFAAVLAGDAPPDVRCVDCQPPT